MAMETTRTELRRDVTHKWDWNYACNTTENHVIN